MSDAPKGDADRASVLPADEAGQSPGAEGARAGAAWSEAVDGEGGYERACEHCLIVDVRPKEAFAAAHIPGSINIPFGHNLPTWAGWVLPYDRPTLIVLDDPAT